MREGRAMTQTQKKNLFRILLSAALLILLAFLPLSGAPRFLAYFAVYLVVGYDILLEMWESIREREPFDESLLMGVASLGALALAAYEDGDYTEAIAVVLFFQVGELFESYAVGKSRRDISALMDIRPDYANIENDKGERTKVAPDTVAAGSIIVVQPGEKIPLDGVVISGTSSLDTVALTGESLLREVHEGDEVLSGCINTNGLLRVRTTKAFGESTASKILALVEQASSRKSRSEAFITRFARIYTPVVVYAAIAVALLPPLVRIFLLGEAPLWGTWVYRALLFLIVSCPCALVIGIPLSFFAGIGGASRHGVLVKGSNYLEALAHVDTVVFDKTGTLTKGKFAVTAVHPAELSPQDLLHIAAHAERFSNHPIAESLREAYPDEADGCEVADVEEIAGKGVRAKVNGKVIYAGNDKLMADIGIASQPCRRKTGTTIHIACDGEYAGHVVISDVVKPHAAAAVRALRQNGVRKTVMLTGDTRRVAEPIAKELGIDTVCSELLPADKVAKVEELLAAKAGGNGKLAFVGDGINDAPVLSRADVGIAMGAMGSDAAIEAADIVLMDDDPLRISVAQRIARKTLRIVYENIIGSIGIKVLIMLLGVGGLANMWMAIFADTGVLILASCNAIRAMFFKEMPVPETVVPAKKLQPDAAE